MHKNKTLFTIVIVITILITMYSISLNKTKANNRINNTNTVSTDNLYLTKGTVIDINTTKDIVTVVTVDGQLFSFKGVEDWLINDDCVLSFDNKGNTDVKDDIIIDILYNR